MVASGSIPENIKTVAVNKNANSIIEVLKAVGFADSNSEARRFIQGGGIKAGSRTICDINYVLSPNKDSVICKGKNKFVRVVFK